jgi:exopolysaccharide production protein ExoZ
MSTNSSSARDVSRQIGSEIIPLQYGRGMAALLVCLFHYERILNQAHDSANAAMGTTFVEYIFRAGHSGVEFFFILSGFIIFRTHRSDINRPRRLASFYGKRAIRILPMFWMIVIPYGLAILAMSSRGAITPGKFILDTLFIPHSGQMTLPAAWTLQHELVFYVLFGVLILNESAGILSLALWQLSCVAVLLFALLPQDYLLPISILFGFYNFGFLFGIAIAILHERFDFKTRSRRFALLVGLTGAAGLLVCFAGEWKTGSDFFPTPAASTLTYFGLYSLVILALLSIENKPRPILDMTLGALGAASYILYIINEPLYSVLEKLLALKGQSSFSTALAKFILCVAIAVAISVVLHYGVERPALRGLRRIFLSNPKPSVAESSGITLQKALLSRLQKPS